MRTIPVDPAALRVKRYRPNDRAALRLFCFPPAGGGLSMFRNWPEGLPPSIDVCSVELPGRERRIAEPPLDSLPPLLDRIVEALRPWVDQPYALFGHSMGALIAFELARRFVRDGEPPPVALFVSAHRAPQLPDGRQPLHVLSDADFMAALAELEGTSRDVLENADLMAIYLPVLKADFAVAESYRYTPGEPLPCSISAFGGREDREVSLAELEAWSVQTAADFSLRLLPGGHFFLQSSPAPLLAEISRALHSAQR